MLGRANPLRLVAVSRIQYIDIDAKWDMKTQTVAGQFIGVFFYFR